MQKQLRDIMKYLLKAAQRVVVMLKPAAQWWDCQEVYIVTRFVYSISVFYDHNSHGLGIVHDMLHGRGLAPKAYYSVGSLWLTTETPS